MIFNPGIMKKNSVIILVIIAVLLLLAGCVLPGTQSRQGPVEVRYAMQTDSAEYDMASGLWNVTFNMTVTITNENTRDPARITTVDIAIWPSFEKGHQSFSPVYQPMIFYESLGPGQSATKRTTFSQTFTTAELSAFTSQDYDIIITVPGYTTTARSMMNRTGPAGGYPAPGARITPPTPSPSVRVPALSPSPSVRVTTGSLVTASPTFVPAAAKNPQGLLVWYDFEDTFMSTGTVTDRSGSGRDATVTGVVRSGTGITGTKGITFTGKGYLLAPDNPAANRKTVTFSFWFRTADPTRNYKFASAARWNGGPGTGWTMATHIPEFWADDGPEGLLVPGEPNADNGFVPGAWTHEAVVYDGTTMKEYTNSTLINTWHGRGVPMSRGVPMAVGGWPQFSGYNFVGDMDDFRIYDRDLSAQEISRIYTDGKG